MSQADQPDQQLTFDPPLYLQRYNFTYDKLFKSNPPIIRMADFGCAEGKFIEHLKQLPFLEKLYAADVQESVLFDSFYSAAPRAWNYVFPRKYHLTISLTVASVSDPDPTFRGLDAISCIELIEHLPADVLKDFPQNVFGYFNPRIVIITTPNVEFNVCFPQLKKGQMRHWDHKFEWTRQQFEDWCQTAAKTYNYTVTFDGVGDPPAEFGDVGHCSQIAIFERIRPAELAANLNQNVSCRILREYEYPKRSATETTEEKILEPIDWSCCIESET